MGQAAVGVAESVDEGDIGNQQGSAVSLLHDPVGCENRLPQVAVQPRRNRAPVVFQDEFIQRRLPLGHGADKDDVVCPRLLQSGR